MKLKLKPISIKYYRYTRLDGIPIVYIGEYFPKANPLKEAKTVDLARYRKFTKKIG